MHKTMNKVSRPLSERQQQILDVAKGADGVLVADVIHLTQYDKAIARSALNTLVRKGYLDKKPVRIRVRTPFATAGLNKHMQKFAKYFLVDPPP